MAEQTDLASPPAEPPPDGGAHRRPGDGGGGGGDAVRFVLRGIGQLLITAGLVVLLFVVYEVYITNVFAQREQRRVHTALEEQWRKGDDVLSLPKGELQRANGEGLANLYIPRFGLDFSWTIVQGVSDADLEKGPGHYPDSQLPGQRGNFAVAGHRVGKGEPFLNLDKLQAGDPVIVETQSTWFVYCVIGAGPQQHACTPGHGALTNRDANGVPGREIVSPSDGQVVAPVPNDPGAAPRDAYLTMTTCHPKFTAAQRMIVHAVLDPAYPHGIAKTKGADGRYSTAIPAPIKAFYSGTGA